MESSRANACHIKQVAGDPQAVQINLMRHQWKEIPPRKHKKKKSFVKPKQSYHKHAVQENPKHQVTTRRALIQEMCTRIKIGVPSVEIPSMWKDFSALQRNSSVKLAISLDTLPVFVTKRSKHTLSLKDQRHINYKQEQCMCKRKPYAASLKITVPVMIPSACTSRCSTHKPVRRSFPHQLTL